MKNKPRFLRWVLPTVVAFISLGCGLPGLAGSTSEPTPTRRVAMLPTFTPTPQLVVVPPTPTFEPSPTPTPQPVEPTPTPPPPTPALTEEAEEASPHNGPLTVTVSQNMNVRSGPGTNYPVVGTAPAGASSAVVGRNSDSSWLQVEYPPGSSNTAWVFAQLVTVSGNPENVAVAQAPPPPPTPVPQPTAPPEAPPPPPEKKYQFMPAAWSASENEGICHFRGTIRDSGGNPVSGYSVLVDNGAYSVISHPSSASHHYPDTVDGQWDVSGIPLRDCVGWWWLTVVKYECPNFETRYDAQCKQFTRLSEDIKIEVDYPRHTVIWADWTCQWDCDKGLYNTPFRR